MSSKEKVCRDCKRFVQGNTCPVCRQSNFSRSWKGTVLIVDPEGSEIAQSLSITVPGKYALWVR
ncbi:MAG: DNA-directed RNA polymerase, subunit E'' [Candidatus Aenigmarchaeota archaeon]|nr:DNA-directed RNA polymerase, subunit E'' [Candidatus Aenigmarchaeota archaeon]